MGFLSDVVAEVRRDLERHPLDDSRLMARCLSLPPTRDFASSLRSGPPAIVAEVKRASPSAGPIAAGDPTRLAQAYQEGGAAAISVLTEHRHFDGALADLRAVHLATTVPVLRKDFLVHPAQLMEARAEGADAALLIAASLPIAELRAMVATAADLGLDALVEAHGEADLSVALDSGVAIIGVNARDLETLEVDERHALELVGRIPRDRTIVLESGITERAQVVRAVDAGAHAVLVGEALMLASNPAAKLRHLRGELVSVEAEDTEENTPDPGSKP